MELIWHVFLFTKQTVHTRKFRRAPVIKYRSISRLNINHKNWISGIAKFPLVFTTTHGWNIILSYLTGVVSYDDCFIPLDTLILRVLGGSVKRIIHVQFVLLLCYNFNQPQISSSTIHKWNQLDIYYPIKPPVWFYINNIKFSFTIAASNWYFSILNRHNGTCLCPLNSLNWNVLPILFLSLSV